MCIGIDSVTRNVNIKRFDVFLPSENYLQNFFELSYSALTKCSTGGLFSELKMNSKDKKSIRKKNFPPKIQNTVVLLILIYKIHLIK